MSITQVILFISVSIDVLCEFLGVAFQSILYVRQLYPSTIFKRKRMYNVPVQVGFFGILLPFTCEPSAFIAGSLESANSSILASCDHFKEVVGKKIKIL